MNRQNRRGLVFLLLGVALLANPLYLYPGNVSHETTLTYEAERTDEVPRSGTLEADVRWCEDATTIARECAIAAALAGGDTLRAPLSDDGFEDAERPSSDYQYVRVADGYYRPIETYENGSLVVSLDPVTHAEVMRAAAVAYEDARPHLREAVDSGSATVRRDDVSRRDTRLVERDGAYYAVRVTESDRHPTGWGWKEPSQFVVDALRLAGWIGGVALVWRAGEWTERGR